MAVQQQQQMAQHEEQQQQMIRKLAALHQVQQEHLVQLMVMLLQPSGLPEAAGMGQRTENSLMGLPVKLAKMGLRDDPEAFLVTFKLVATATHWPAVLWTP